MADFGGDEGGLSPLQTVDKKLFSPEGGRIALSANERIAGFFDFAIQIKFAYVNKQRGGLIQPALYVDAFFRRLSPVPAPNQSKIRFCRSVQPHT